MNNKYFGQRRFVQERSPFERFEASKKPATRPESVSKRTFAWASYNFLLISSAMCFQPQTAAAAVETVKSLLPM